MVLALALFLAAFPGVAGTIQESPTPVAEIVPRTPLVVGVAIDEAGIAPADLRKSLDLVLALFDLLPKGSKMALGSFSRDQRIVLPETSNRSELSRALGAFKGREPEVALPDGLFDLVEYLASLEADSRAVLLVSAGSLREGDLQFEDPLNAAATKGIPIVTLGLGQGDGKMLRRVAKLTGGEYVRLEVADAAMLAHSIIPRASPSPKPTRKPDPQTEPAPRPSVGLLGAAALLLALGGLLMLGIIALLVRRRREHAAIKPAEAPVVALAVAPKVAPTVAEDEEPFIEDENALEKTLVVNANPILRALSGPGAGKNFPLSPSGTTSLGRSRRNDIVVPEDAASAQHCRIDREGDSYVLHDLGATNGSWVNGTRTERAVLQHGDRVKVGETVFTVSLFGDRS